ncbi:MAG: phytase [Microscillaceae bacterium]
MKNHAFTLLAAVALATCQPADQKNNSPVGQEVLSKPTQANTESQVIKPVFTTDTTQHDTDDPAIWVNPNDPAQSLIVGTDKDEEGALYVFDLKGKIVKVVKGLKRPNNVDIEYGLVLNGQKMDIAVAAERLTHKLRIFRLPDMEAIDGGGIEIFKGETGPEHRDLMGIALYKNPASGKIYAIAGRKNGPTDGTYLWQYELSDNGQGQVKAELVRKFGKYSGKNEIEAIAVDDALGYVYYCDEGIGIRKYYADPAKGNEELALFGTKGFQEDHEGISIYTISDGTGYILVSDQQANQFHIFPREGQAKNPHQHDLIKIVKVSTNESDGSEVSSVAFNDTFANGLFVAMSDNKTFQLYRWEDLAGKDLKLAPNGRVKP